MSPNSLGERDRGHQCGHGDSSQIARQGKAGSIKRRRSCAGAHTGHYAPNADPEGHDESSQQAHNGTLPREHTLLSPCQPNKPACQFPASLVIALLCHSPGAPAHDCGAGCVTHWRVCTRKEHPKAEESEQWPPNHAKDADCCLQRTVLKK